MKHVVIIASLALVGMLAGGKLAMAGASDEAREAAAILGAKVSLTQAIGIAEQQTGGKAYDAGVNLANGHSRIVVETNGPRGVQTVVVDTQTGAVASMHAGGEAD